MNQFPLFYTCPNCLIRVLHNGELNGILMTSLVQYRTYYCPDCFMEKKKENKNDNKKKICNCFNCRTKNQLFNHILNVVDSQLAFL